uniref:Uncharacterized protein n=1 Tax=Solanum lycopersicum TaxID=4081 RepID=A0A3Q7FVM8_SOLLC
MVASFWKYFQMDELSQNSRTLIYFELSKLPLLLMQCVEYAIQLRESGHFRISSAIGDDDGVGGWFCGEPMDGLADGVGGWFCGEPTD